ncbi:MAG: cob(I)yrinic acid a,c-diamide adenosyltransferase [Synechococcus sp. BS301-5m-G54]|jgi:cob(I)alamin adenosyltransferase|uniref:cob(I)yrinic acid a,c-diamide adenosyltransferase n=1 Tax=Synechococcales TaxID=1890424 RepID=UPI0004E06E7F|nr:cob(I)yrinic acid a,c-diamide adenosyltransferase [Synechococcus sp. KORDI-49]AII46833.1 cob(I)alamin adenosyltransferase [Synechococcus sp. KORDI-49]MBL6739177.1 cob(I)yrinic acid a,c-diamide adenosyltransferase [Synechococcus sp. BS301-5m-G54]MBL6795332.1 cob(I)yrinic acid a,c-diamide adenosyltransferase [Synechococcus sp. BS307-5m-G34]RCL54687.1 MAG: cob(I)alamin adenolsyltransferase [Synechococcus sp. MED-G70]|tara:strand:+ start:193 stop:792 length:600 start_codon:yes stop_codon:yes gene_type:complete
MTASLTTSHRSSGALTGDRHALERAGLRPLPPLPASAPLHLVAPEGQLQVHTASYRGSFSSVLSQAMRAAGLGSRVLIAQFLKGGVKQGPEGCVLLCGGLTWLRPDIPACLAEPDQPGGSDAVDAVWQACRRHLAEGDLDQLVLDEVGLAAALGYLKEDELLSSLQQRPGSMDVIITGPAIPSSVMAMADQVTELRRGF